jgi:hypothetical protein
MSHDDVPWQRDQFPRVSPKAVGIDRPEPSDKRAVQLRLDLALTRSRESRRLMSIG